MHPFDSTLKPSCAAILPIWINPAWFNRQERRDTPRGLFIIPAFKYSVNICGVLRVNLWLIPGKTCVKQVMDGSYRF